MKPDVLVVGVYHLGDTTDLTRVEQKSISDLKLQSQEVVQALSQFNPTKLAVEAVCEVQKK